MLRPVLTEYRILYFGCTRLDVRSASVIFATRFPFDRQSRFPYFLGQGAVVHQRHDAWYLFRPASGFVAVGNLIAGRWLLSDLFALRTHNSRLHPGCRFPYCGQVSPVGAPRVDLSNAIRYSRRLFAGANAIEALCRQSSSAQ